MFQAKLSKGKPLKLKDRIDELERKVRELESRPIVYPPVYYPYPAYPVFMPVQPWHPPYHTTCKGLKAIGIGGDSSNTCGNDAITGYGARQVTSISIIG
jgi:hypothetical protein